MKFENKLLLLLAVLGELVIGLQQNLQAKGQTSLH
jgi:hypothetical protein